MATPPFDDVKPALELNESSWTGRRLEADDFLRRLAQGCDRYAGFGLGEGDSETLWRHPDTGELSLSTSTRSRLEAALADTAPLEDDCAGTDSTARLLSVFCLEQGGDARTMRTFADTLQLLEPPLSSADMFFCLVLVVRRFAPVALMNQAGHALMQLCRLFEQLLLFHDPDVAFLLRRARIDAETYCAPWLLTAHAARHAAGLAVPDAALWVWRSWLDEGESLDPIFLGLARLIMCRDELLLCGPVPELGQLLHSSLGAERHAIPRVVDAALARAAQLKVTTPLTFLRKLQERLLRPAEPLVVAPSDQSRSTASQAEAKQVDAANAEALAGLQAVRQRAANWFQGRKPPAPKASTSAPSTAPPSSTQALVCMRVEPQDVMMLETVKERHLRKQAVDEQESSEPSEVEVNSEIAQEVVKPSEAEEGVDNSPSDRREEENAETLQELDAKPDSLHNAESSTSPSPQGALDAGEKKGTLTSPASGGCRLVPRLIDVRRSADVRRDGVSGSIVVDVTREDCVPEFLNWARQRSDQVSQFGLQPMHVLMTADGGITADQQKFLKGVLEKGLESVCILGSGYDSLKPFFVQDPDAVEEPGAKVAREMLKKGIGNLQSLWQKAPTRQHLWEKVSAEGNLRNSNTTTESSWSSATFDRAPLPPSLEGDGGYVGNNALGN